MRITSLSVLKDVRTLLSDPVVWTQRTKARTIDSQPCPPTSLAAAQWCLCGAIDRCCYGTMDHIMSPDWTLRVDQPQRKLVDVHEKLKLAGEVHTDVHRLLRFTLSPRIIPLEKYNDEPARTHDDIIGLLDKTIERIKDFSY